MTGPRASSSGIRPLDGVIAALVALLATGAALLQLFLGPDLGLADNGDGRRVLCEVGLQPPPRPSMFTDVVFGLPPLTDAAAGACDRGDMRYTSSQVVLVEAVQRVDDLVTGPGLDLRAVGAVVCALFGLGLAALYLALPGGRAVRLLAVGITGALLLDVAYAHYFSSAYSESAGFLGIVWTVAALAWLGRRPVGAGPLLALLAAAGFLATAKTQLTPLAGLVIGLVLLRTWQFCRETGSGRRPVLLAGAFAVALAGTSALLLAYQGHEFQRANMHNLVLHTVVPLADDPRAALADMGLEPSLAAYAGTHAFEADLSGDPAYAEFTRVASRAAVLGHLAGHPDVVAEMLLAGLDQVGDPRTGYLAELSVAERGEAAAEADRWSFASDLLRELRPAAWPLLPLGWVVLVGWGTLLSVRRHVFGADLRGWGLPIVFTGLGAASQVVVSLVGDGYYELAKHEVFVSYLTWPALVLSLGSVAHLLGIRLDRRSRPGGSGGRRRTDPVRGDRPGRRAARTSSHGQIGELTPRR